MPIIINQRACDRSPGCPAVRSCPNGALRYNPVLNRVEVNNEECLECAACVRRCPTGAVRQARSYEELEYLKAKFEGKSA